MDIEILAPAGGMDSLVAAVRCGANAVYLGTLDMNARRNATNFDKTELKQAVEYCHRRGVLVYLALNTLVADDEMTVAYYTVDYALSVGVDAFIIQDIGLAKMVHRCFPDARMHASTQCSAITPDGFRALQDIGFCRAVVPREMTADEIAEIRRSTDMELEMFVHGALCMSVSGQCYMSAMIGSRSGNRGRCAQPCRLAFSANNSGSCDLSLKDLSLISRIGDIAELGVVSLKIEGRMKRPEYVAAAVTACRRAVDGCYSVADEDRLRSVFSRSGFTDGYFTGKRLDMFGVRRRDDVVSAAGVLKELSHLYDNENPLLPLDMHLDFLAEKPVSLVVTCGDRTATACGAVPEKAINRPLTADMLRDRISKLGGTQYFANNVTVNAEDGLILPAGQINDLRRRAVEMLDDISVAPHTALPPDPISARHRSGAPYFTARFADPDTIPDRHPFRRVFIPIWCDDEDFIRHNAGVELPRGLFGMEDKMRDRLVHLYSIGVTMALCPNIGAYRTAQEIGFEVYGDFGLNVFNSTSARQFCSPILSPELTLDRANRINADDVGIIVYGKLPLMLTRNCPIKNHIGCAECGGNGKLTDRKGYEFPVRCSPYPCVEVFNSLPIILSDKMCDIRTDFVHFYFTDETAEDVDNLVNMYKKQIKPDTGYTRGLYYRGVG